MYELTKHELESKAFWSTYAWCLNPILHLVPDSQLGDICFTYTEIDKYGDNVMKKYEYTLDIPGLFYGTVDSRYTVEEFMEEAVSAILRRSK